MCGIAGYMGVGDEQALVRMNRALSHRGPDDEGVWCEDGIGLAHRRLAIIDLTAAGHQPMSNEAKDLALIFNGEIFNYKELREQLQKRGHIFVSQSDTEVILKAYEEYGEECPRYLIGQFAIALFDKKKNQLFLARDRFGEKPLYWAFFENTFVFASEPKGIFAHGKIPKELNASALASYMTYDAALTPESMYLGVHKLGAGKYMTVRNGEITEKKYWNPSSINFSTSSFAEAKEELDALFRESVASQLVADVPVGVFLSGGLDSSLVAYYAKQIKKEPVHTFSIGFDDPSFDESTYAREVAAVLGTEHHEYRATASDVRSILPEVISKLDEPIADPAILPNYLLARFAREHVTVALGGDGGDELFAGYQTFAAEKILSWYKRMPKLLRTGLLEPVANNLPVSHKYFSLDFKAKQFLRGAHMPEQYVHQAWLESMSRAEQEELLTPRFRSALPGNQYAQLDAYIEDAAEKDIHFKNSYLYLRTYMQDDILAKVDRSSMYHSLEVRAPFLDQRVAEFALSLPWEYKFHGLTGKYILKRLMDGKLPRHIIERKKHGFGLPVGAWFMNEWRELLEDTLSVSNVERVGVFAPQAVKKLVEEHVSGARNHRKKLWSLLVFHLWYDTWIA